MKNVVFPVLTSGLPFPVYSGGTYGIYTSQPSLPLPHGALDVIETRIISLELGSTALAYKVCFWLYAKSEPQLEAMQRAVFDRLRIFSIEGSSSGVYMIEDDIYTRSFKFDDLEVWSSAVYFTVKGVS